MDEHRFDTLVRNLVATRSRRQCLRGLAAAGAAALAFHPGAVPVAAQVASTDETCSQDSDCVPAETDSCTGAYCDAGSCTYTSVACIPGYVCCGNGECCPEAAVDSNPDVTNGDAGESGESDETQAESTEMSEPDCAAAHPSE